MLLPHIDLLFNLINLPPCKQYDEVIEKNEYKWLLESKTKSQIKRKEWLFC